MTVMGCVNTIVDPPPLVAVLPLRLPCSNRASCSCSKIRPKPWLVGRASPMPRRCIVTETESEWQDQNASSLRQSFQKNALLAL